MWRFCCHAPEFLHMSKGFFSPPFHCVESNRGHFLRRQLHECVSLFIHSFNTARSLLSLSLSFLSLSPLSFTKSQLAAQDVSAEETKKARLVQSDIRENFRKEGRPRRQKSCRVHLQSHTHLFCVLPWKFVCLSRPNFNYAFAPFPDELSVSLSVSNFGEKISSRLLCRRCIKPRSEKSPL